jgi:hypothetical protein
VLAAGMFVQQRRAVRPLMRDAFRTPVDEMVGESS